MTKNTYRIQPPPAVRAYGLAALLAVLGAALIVLASANAWPVVFPALGVLLLVLGVALIALAVLAGRRAQVIVALDERGYTIRDSSGPREGAWSDITQVTRGPGRLTFHDRNGHGFLLRDPATDPGLLDRLAADVSAHLDRDRGYGAPVARPAEGRDQPGL